MYRFAPLVVPAALSIRALSSRSVVVCEEENRHGPSKSNITTSTTASTTNTTPAKAAGGYANSNYDNRVFVVSNSSSASSSASSSSSLDSVSVQRYGTTTVLMANKNSVMRKLDAFRRGGPQKMQVITDFDYTLTRYSVNGSPGLSCHRLIEGSGFIPEHIVHQTDAMFRYYYPIEISQTVPQEEKEKHMLDWATRAGELLQQSGIQRSEVTLAVSEALKSRSFALREHVPAFFAMLEKRQVPVLLFSAGIGDVIEETLAQQLGKVPQDVHVVSNHMIFGDAGRVVGWTEPVFHVFNKKASAAAHSPFFSRYDIAHRENVLLIGDSLGDVRMSDGLHFHPDSIVRVGYLNTKVERLNEYLAAFDVVIIGDPGFGFINAVLEDVLEIPSPAK